MIVKRLYWADCSGIRDLLLLVDKFLLVFLLILGLRLLPLLVVLLANVLDGAGHGGIGNHRLLGH